MPEPKPAAKSDAEREYFALDAESYDLGKSHGHERAIAEVVTYLRTRFDAYTIADVVRIRFAEPAAERTTDTQGDAERNAARAQP